MAKGRRGPVPSDAVLKRMKRDGYLTISAAAREYSINPTTLYAWVGSKRLEPIGGKPPAVRVGANLFVLASSVERRTSMPAEV
jgi:transposase-like protein